MNLAAGCFAIAGNCISLGNISGTLAVNQGGTGQTSFGQGWLNSDGTTLSASTSPTVNYITATSTTATSNVSTGGFTVGTSQFVVQQGSGNVGIGTTAPNSTLDVVGGNPRFENGSSGADLEFWNGGSFFDAIGTLAKVSNSGASTDLALRADAGRGIHFLTGGTTERMVLNSTGNLGIGTTSPYSLLSISNSAGTAANTPLFTIASTTGGTSTSTLMTVLANGNVGIGTTNPSQLLEVDSGTSGFQFNAASQRIGGSFGSGGALELTANTASTNGGGDIQLGGSTRGDALKSAIVFNESGTEYMRIDGNATGHTQGNVGIGTTSPDVLLSVGSATPSGNVAHFENSTGSCYINPTTTSLSCSSDERLKTNINSLTASSGLDALMQLNPVTYNWKSESATTSPHTGFIAQQVLPILPDLVSQGPDGYYTLNYAGFTPYIIKAVQEMASISGSFESALIAWLGNASNGITDLYASIVHTNQVISNKDDTQELCVGSTCVTPEQFQAMVAAANQSSTSPTPPPSSDNGAAASSSPDSFATPPVVQVNGDNPAIIQVGATYTDLGATIEGPQADLNLGITTYVNGTPTNPVQLNTSTVATDTIDYVATDQNGLTSCTSVQGQAAPAT